MSDPKLQPENKKKSTAGNVLRYSGLGMQIAVIIGGGSYFGRWLDDNYGGDKNWYTLGLVLFSTALAMYHAIKTLNRINK